MSTTALLNAFLTALQTRDESTALRDEEAPDVPPQSRAQAQKRWRKKRDPELLEFVGPAGTATPTAAPPASEEKVQVLIGRFERGESLFHRQDAELDLRLGYEPGPVIEGAIGRGQLVEETTEGKLRPVEQLERPEHRPKYRSGVRNRAAMDRKNASRHNEEHRARERERKWRKKHGWVRDPSGQIWLFGEVPAWWRKECRRRRAGLCVQLRLAPERSAGEGLLWQAV